VLTPTLDQLSTHARNCPTDGTDDHALAVALDQFHLGLASTATC
jgi:hypothetical protein